MTSSWRWTVVSLAAIGALCMGRTWLERAGIFSLTMAFVMTIDLAGDKR